MVMLWEGTEASYGCVCVCFGTWIGAGDGVAEGDQMFPVDFYRIDYM